MQWRLVDEKGGRTFVLIFQTGDEAIASLTAFAKEHDLAGSHFTGLGAFSDVVLGYFEWERKDYARIPLREQVEVLSFVGDVSLEKGEHKIHAHVVVGRSDGTAHGGHLLEGHVRPTLEVTLTESPTHLQRRFDPESGIALIDLGEAET